MPNQLVNFFRTKFPDQANLPEDEITLKYADAAPIYAQQGQNLEELYPDWAADVKRIRDEKTWSTISTGEKLKHAAGALGSSVVRTAGEIGVEFPATALSALTGEYFRPDIPARKAVEAAAEYVRPEIDKEKEAVLRQSFMLEDVPSGLGSMGVYGAGGAGLGAIGKAAGVAKTAAGAARLGTAVSGFASGFSQGFNDATSRGADFETAFKSGVLNAGVGLSEAVPIARFVERLSGIAPSAKQTLVRALLETSKETFEEGFQEFGQSAAADTIAAEILKYDPDRKMFDTLARESGAGAVTGALVSALTQAISRGRRRRAPGAVEKDATIPLEDAKEIIGKEKAPPGPPPPTGIRGETPPPPPATEAEVAAQEEAEALKTEVAAQQYNIDEKGLNDLVARRVSGGEDSVAVEVSKLEPDARRLYEGKLVEALKVVSEKPEPKPEPGTPVTATTVTIPAVEATKVETPAVEATKVTTEPEPAVPTTTGAPNAIPVEGAATIPVQPGAGPGQAVGQEVRGAEEPAAVGQEAPAQEEGKVTPAPDTAAAGAATAATAPPATEAPAPEAPAPEPAPEVAKQDANQKRIGEKIAELHTTNTGEDSREFVAGQAAGMTDLSRRYAGMEAVLRSAIQRVDTAMQTMPDKPVDLLTADEVIALGELDDTKTGATQAAGVKELLAHKKAKTLNRGLLISWANRVRGESISADNRLRRLSEKSGTIDPRGKEPLTPDQLVNPYAINYNPQKKGDTPPPAGYFELNGSGGEAATNALLEYERAATDEAREAAARKLGDELLVGSRVGANRKLTKRLVAWQSPDGSVSVLAGKDQSQPRSEGKKATANQAWRFTIGSTDRTKKGDIEGGNVGIDTLLKAGYRPIASMAMMTPRVTVAVRFADRAAYNEAIGTEARTQQSEANETQARFVADFAANKAAATSAPAEAAAIGGESPALQAWAEANVMGKPTGAAGMESVESEAPTPSEVAAAKEERKKSKAERSEEEMKALVQRAGEWIGNHMDVASQLIRYFDANPKATFADAVNAFFGKLVTEKLAQSGTSKRDQDALAAHIEELYRKIYDNEKAFNNFRAEVRRVINDEIRLEAPTGKVVEGKPGGLWQNAPGGGRGGGVPGQGAQAGTEEAAPGQAGAGGEGAGVESPKAFAEASRKATEFVRGQARENMLTREEADAAIEKIDNAESIEQLNEIVGSIRIDESRAALIASINSTVELVESHVESETFTREQADSIITQVRAAKTLDHVELLTNAISIRAEKIKEENQSHDDEEPDQDEDDSRPDYSRSLVDTPQNIRRNISRAAARDSKQATAARGVRGVMSLKAAQKLLETPTVALKWAASFFRSSDRGGGEAQARVADLLASMVELTGVTIRVVDDPTLARTVVVNPETGETRDEAVHGRYNSSENEVLINLAHQQDGYSMAQTVTHEFVHGLLSRLIRRFHTDRNSLTPAQIRVIEQLELISLQAEQSGIRWQDMNSSAAKRLNEFVAAAMTDSGFQVKLNQTMGRFRVSAIPQLKVTKPERLSLWQSFKRAVASLIASEQMKLIGITKLLASAGITRESLRNEEQREAVVQRNLLEPALEALEFLIIGYNGQTAYLDADFSMQMKMPQKRGNAANKANEDEDISYMVVEGQFKNKHDISVETSTTGIAVAEARRTMATVNDVDDAIQSWMRAWNTLGKGVATASDFMKGIVSEIVGTSLRSTEQARLAIHDAVGTALAPQVSNATSIADLPDGERQKAMRDSYIIKKKFESRLRKHNRVAESFLRDTENAAKLTELQKDEAESLRAYDDLRTTKRFLLRDMRRALEGKEDTGAIAIGTALKLGNPNADTRDALRAMQGNIDQSVNSIVALANTGVDFSQVGKSGGPTIVDVQNAVTTSTDPDLNMLATDPAKLAVAIMFARNRPLLMDLLSTLKAGQERGLLNDIIKLAVEDRPDAFDRAVASLSKLTRLGAQGQRVLQNLRKSRARTKEFADLTKRYTEVREFYDTIIPVIYRDLNRLENELGMEYGIGGAQWSAYHGVGYFVPPDKNAKEWDFGSPTKANPDYKKLKLGDEYDGKAVQEDIFKIKAWLDANPDKAGSAMYRRLQRQADRLTRVHADQADYHIRRGPLGWIIGLLGDIATKLDWTGMAHCRNIAVMCRDYNAKHDRLIRDKYQREFLEYDKLKREVRQAIGITNLEDFNVRFYDRALNYLEMRQDLIDPKLTPQQQNRVSAKAAIEWLADGREPIAKKPEVRDGLQAFFEKAFECSDITVRKKMPAVGLRIAESIGKNRYVFRDPVGATPHAMSRGLSGLAFRVVTDDMVKAGWKKPIAPDMPGFENQSSLRGELVESLYSKDRARLQAIVKERFPDTVVRDFAGELCYKEGTSNFFGVKEESGRLDKAERANVIAAFDEAVANHNGDMLWFTERLYTLEGGNNADAVAKAEFVAQTLGTFQKYYGIIYATTELVKSSQLDESDTMGRSFMDAREGEDFPAAWLSYLHYGEKENVRYGRMMAQQSAFGRDSESLVNSFNAAKAQLRNMIDKSDRAKMDSTSEAERIRLLGGKEQAKIIDAARDNLVRVETLERDLKNLLKTQNGVPQDLRAGMKLLGLIAGYTVQGASTAFTDTISMVDSPLRKFGFSKLSRDMVFGNYKGFVNEVWATLMQAFGMSIHVNKEYADQTRLLNESGLLDPDAMVNETWIKSYAVRFKEFLGDEQTFAGLWQEYQRTQKAAGTGSAVSGMSKGALRKLTATAAAGMRAGLDVGIGRAKSMEVAAATFKPWAIFTQINLWMHRAVARSWHNTICEAARMAGVFMKANPAAATDPSFKLTAKDMEMVSSRLGGFSTNDQFNALNELLQKNGIQLEECGRRLALGLEPFTKEQEMSIMSLAQSEILNNTGILTRPAWSLNSPIGRMSSPLVGWSIYRMADVAKSLRDPKGRATADAFRQSLLVWSLGVLPAALTYALLRDWYEEEIVGKKPNVLALKADASLPWALLDNLNRVGTLGIAGDATSSIFQVSTQREFSVDSRVFALNSMMNLARTLGAAVQQGGTTTWASTWRQVATSLGGSGYLQNFDAVNNLLEMSPTERRIIRRINVNNQLRAAGRALELDVAVPRGIKAIPNPMKPWIRQMELAAYGDDMAGFRDAYAKAREAATNMAKKKKDYQADPVADVAEALQRIHPLRNVFGKSPSTAEYQRLLRELGNDAPEVAKAIRNFNSYAAQIPSKRGGEGIKPFYGTERKKPSGITTSFGGSGFGSMGFRGITASP